MHAWSASDFKVPRLQVANSRSVLKMRNKPGAGLNGWSKNEAKKEMDSLFQEFVESTTLPGVTQVCKRRKIEWKLFWFFVSLGATIMSIYQSWPILKDFIDGKTVQSTTYSADFDFPSVTICSNLRLTKLKPESVFYDFEAVSDIPINDLIFAVLKRELQVNESAVNDKYKPTFCTFNKKPCSKDDMNDLYYFRTAYFGPCVTFNVGTQMWKRGRPNNVLTFTFGTDRTKRSYWFNENFIQVWVHPPGTAPVLYRSEGTRVYPGDFIEIRFDLKSIARLPKRGNECLDPLTAEQRISNIYYSENATYIYSSKACVYSLLFDTKLDKYGCLDTAVPMNNRWIDLWRSQMFNICEPGMNVPNASATPWPNEHNNEESNETDFNTLYNFDANCSLPCSEWMVDYSAISTSAWFESLVSESLTNKSKSRSKPRWDNRRVELRFNLATTVVEVVDEDYRYKTGDFAGIIGGNVGLWIGLCVISLAELVELGIRIVSANFQRLFFGVEQKERTIKVIHVSGPYH